MVRRPENPVPDAWEEPLVLYRRDQRRRGLAESSIHTRRRILVSLARYYPEGPWTLTPDTIEAWLDSSRSRGKKTRYVYLSGVSGFYRWAIRHDLATVNPVDKVDRPRLKKGLPRPISTDDLVFALRVASPRMKAWLLLGALEGLRCMEIAGMTREWILDGADPPMIHVIHGKGDRERPLPLHPVVLAQLRVVGMPRRGPIFPNRVGDPYTGHSVSRLISRYLHDLGIDATMHQLRHWFGTMIYQRTRDLRLTQELMGHQSSETTDIYTAWSKPEAVTAVTGLLDHPSLAPLRSACLADGPDDDLGVGPIRHGAPPGAGSVAMPPGGGYDQPSGVLSHPLITVGEVGVNEDRSRAMVDGLALSGGFGRRPDVGGRGGPGGSLDQAEDPKHDEQHE